MLNAFPTQLAHNIITTLSTCSVWTGVCLSAVIAFYCTCYSKYISSRNVVGVSFFHVCSLCPMFSSRYWFRLGRTQESLKKTVVMVTTVSSLAVPQHDDVIKWKHCPCYWPFVWGEFTGPRWFPHKSQWRGALMFSLICVRINSWENNRGGGDLRRSRAHYDVIVMKSSTWQPGCRATQGLKLTLIPRSDFLLLLSKSWSKSDRHRCYFLSLKPDICLDWVAKLCS